MSSISLQVELPQYEFSFSVEVSQTGCVQDIKEEIARTCPGSPHVDGQRLIWKGRILADAEKIEQVWENPDERILHLAVNPWAWSTQPPGIRGSLMTSSQAVIPERSTLSGLINTREHMYQPVTYPISPYFHSRYASTFFVDILHTSALEKLTGTKPSVYSHIQKSTMQEIKSLAKTIITSCGYIWPAIFDEDYPAESSDEGVKYNIVMLMGVPFYQLTTPNAIPNAQQLHALRVLTYTFPLLTLPTANPGIPMHLLGQSVQFPHANLSNDIAVPQGADPQIQLRVVSLRALLAPVILLCFRILILFYFFSPTHKPIFGILLGVWIIYEAWGAIRGINGDVDQNNVRHQAGPLVGVGGGDRRHVREVPNPEDQGVRRQVQVFNYEGSQMEVFLNSLAQLNMSIEAHALYPPENITPLNRPSLGAKMRMFICLFFVSFHPAIWNRRNKFLKERERRLRAELSALDNSRQDVGPGGDEEAAHAREHLANQFARRPMWLREYLERVRRGEWVDD